MLRIGWMNWRERVFWRPVLVRLLQSVLSLWLVTVLFFFVMEMAPGDFAIQSAPRGATAGMLASVRFELGLYDAAPVRYLNWLIGLMSGDLGISWWSRTPVAALIADRLWHTAWLFTWSVLITIPLSFALALIAVIKHNSVVDRVSSVVTLSLLSIPEFAIVYGLLILLTLHFDVFPAFTLYALDMSFAERIYASALPILSLTAVTVTPMFRLSRAALINVMTNEYVQMAELKGLTRCRVVVRHALPNALGPMANATALAVANLFFGLVIVEVIFSYPGLGSLLYTAVRYHDLPLLQSCGLISAVVAIGLSLVADIVGLMANPKLRDTVESKGSYQRVASRRTLSRIRKIHPALVSAMLCLAVFVGTAVAWSSSVIEEPDIVLASAPTGEVRDRLTADQLFGIDPENARLIHYDYFMPFGDSRPPIREFQGILNVPTFKARRRSVDSSWRQEVTLPGFETTFTTHNDILLPIESDRIIPMEGDYGSDHWSIILSPGRVWHEPADGGWSRASFPFTLISLSGHGPHYGVATFLYNETSVSQLRFQIAQETANWAQYDVWGQTQADYRPGPVAGVRQVRESYDRMVASRLDIRPWADLADQYWRSHEIFDGEGNRGNVAVSGLMVDDVFYLRPCRTRAGLHPFCREMRFGVFSITKSLGAGVAMLWLAQKYGPQVFDEKITDYVSIPAEHDGWDGVTFGHALDMVTGIGNVVPERVDYYVEADFTAVSRSVWIADSIREKLEAMAVFKDYPWGPGEVFRYRTTDTTALAAAMEAYLRRKEGPDADLWDTLTQEVFTPLGIERLPVRRTIEPDGRLGTPLLGAGLYITVEEALKIARLLQDLGEMDGEQLLHRDLTKRALSTDMQRGYPNGWRGKGRTEGHYEMSFWLTPHEQMLGCDLRIPVMAGFGGNYLIIMPNRTIGLRFADGHDDNPDTWDSAGIRDVSNRIRSFCP